MMLYPFFYKKFIYPAYHHLKNDNVWKLTKELEKNQWLSGDDLLKLQQIKLDSLLKHAVVQVPYYRDLVKLQKISVDKIGCYEHFSKLPFLTKKKIRENINSLVAQNLDGNRIFPNSTSGSTGEALYFFTDTHSQSYRKACVNRSNKWTGWDLGDGIVKLWGAPIDIKKTETFRGLAHEKITRTLTLSSYDLNPEKMDQYIENIERFKPTLMVSYPGPLEVFASHVKSRKKKFPTVNSIITSAEQLFDYQRKLIENALEAKVFNRYGCREFGDIAQECGENSGLHINIDRFFIEVLNTAGDPAGEDELGELYITDLDNYGMPMIRYQIGDKAAWSKQKNCKCKRGLPLISKIEGRSLDVIITKSGHGLGGTFWTILFKSKPGIKQFQIVQNSASGIIVNYIPDEHYTSEILSYFKSKILNKCGNDFTVIFKQVDKIEKTSSGKSKFIISNIKKVNLE